MIRLIPPVAVPVGPLEVAATVLDGRAGHPDRFAERLLASTGMRSAYLCGSGRAALCAYLRHIASPGRDVVVVPAYTCWSVPASVVRAGLKVRLVDVRPTSFDMVPARLEEALGPRTLAVIPAHLLAPSADVAAIAATVKKRDPVIKVIEDAAQAWPDSARENVDAVLLSFGRGKPLPLGKGGALLCNESSADISSRMSGGGWAAALSLAMTSALGSPTWYRIPESMPFLGIGLTEYDPGFDRDAPFRKWQARLGVKLLGDLPRLKRERSRNAARLAARVGKLGGVAIPDPAHGEGPLRFPVLAASREARDAMLPALRRRGVSATRLYPAMLADISALQPHLADPQTALPGAKELADRLLTLPVYPGLDDADVDSIADAFERALGEVAT